MNDVHRDEALAPNVQLGRSLPGRRTLDIVTGPPGPPDGGVRPPAGAGILPAVGGTRPPAGGGQQPPSGGGDRPAAGGADPPPPGDGGRGIVRGRVVDADGGAVAHARVVVVALLVRGESVLAEERTDAAGSYVIPYRRQPPVTLAVRVLDDSGKVIGQAPTIFRADVEVKVDLTTAKDGVVRPESAYTILSRQIEEQTRGALVEALQEAGDKHEVSFVARAAGVPFRDVAHLVLAGRLAKSLELRPETLFALFSRGIPASLDPALAALPTSSLDDTFSQRLRDALLTQAEDVLASALRSAQAANIIGTAYSAIIDQEMARLRALLLKDVASRPFGRGKTPLQDVLKAVRVPDSVQNILVRKIAQLGDRPGLLWKAIGSDPAVPKEQIPRLKAALSAAQVLGGYLPLLGQITADFDSRRLTNVRELGRLDRDAWAARIRAVDPAAEHITPVVPDETTDQRIERFAATLEQRFERRFPTAAFAGRLASATASPFAQRQALQVFFDGHPDFDLGRMHVDRYLAEKNTSLAAPVVAELKRAQRLFRLDHRYDAVAGLAKAKYGSGMSIVFSGRTRFVSSMAPALGGIPKAHALFDRAELTYAHTLTLFGQYNLSLTSPSPVAIGSPPTPTKGQLDAFPTVQSLFGSLDFCECPDCRSVTSPAAYFVDLLHYLRGRATATGTALDILLGRRPDLAQIALTCANTEVKTPYIDLVNEILEDAVGPPSGSTGPKDTNGTDAERRAMPQRVRPEPYEVARLAAFPLRLPFDLAFAQTQAFLSSMGSSRAEVLRLFRDAPGAASEDARANDALGLNDRMAALVVGTDTHQRWERWGLHETGNLLSHPRYPDDPTKRVSGQWDQVLAHIPVLLQRAALSLRELYQLLEVRWVTKGSVELQVGTDANGVVLCDTDAMVFRGLTGEVLDRMQQFLRLQRATGLSPWELDWAIEVAGGALEAPFVVFLARVLELRTRLGLPIADVLAFWNTIGTRGTISHLSDQDIPIPSPYDSTFRSATLRSWATLFVEPAGPFTGLLSDDAVSGAVTAALGLHAEEVSMIVTARKLSNALSLDTLSSLFRVARLATALSLSVRDLLLFIELTEVDPFPDLQKLLPLNPGKFSLAPEQSLEFLRRLDLLRQTGLSAFDLDYLLRHSSADRTTLAFTADTADAVLADIRSALGKLSVADRVEPLPVEAICIQKLAAALSVTANVVQPLLTATGILPFGSPLVSDLLERTPDDTYRFQAATFLMLTDAFTRVAKGAALFLALKPTELEFTFLVQRASTFGWQDPAGLPTTLTASSGFHRLETLLAALRIQRLKRARSPKPFDMLASWFSAPPASLATARDALAKALDVLPTDVIALGDALGLTTVADMRDQLKLARLADALAYARRWGIRGSTVILLATDPPSEQTARTARSTFEAQYDAAQWLTTIQPVEDSLRESRRDALVALLLAPNPTLGMGFNDVDQIYGHYLIDPQMSACFLTTRLKQGAASVQQFVQRAFLNLEPALNVDSLLDSAWDEWEWMKHYRLWEANRKVFLWPENYLLPELRRDKSPFFDQLEKQLLQSDLDADTTEAAFHDYLDRLVEVSRLVICAHFHELKPDGSKLLHVFARTQGTPPKWFYRTRAEALLGHGRWSAWEKLDVGIEGRHLIPAMWNRRLHLLWPSFTEKSEQIETLPVPKSGDRVSPPTKYWTIELSMSERRSGKWLPKRTYHEKMFIPRLNDAPDAFTFKAAPQGGGDLHLDMYQISLVRTFDSSTESDLVTNTSTDLLARATFTSPAAPLQISQQATNMPGLVDPNHEPSYALVAPLTDIAALTPPLQYMFVAQDLAYAYQTNSPVFGSVWRSTLPKPVPLWAKQAVSTGAQLVDVKLLNSIVLPRVAVAHPAPQFDSTDPFFVSDPDRVFFVQPHFFRPGSYGPEIDTIPDSHSSYATPFATRYAFAAFYHPFASLFVRELAIGGVDQLMRRVLQVDPEGVRGGTQFAFSTYGPDPSVYRYATEDVDFSADGAYSLYNWELFYHAPMLIVARLVQNHQHKEALRWLQYVFDPTDTSTNTAPQRYWRTRPFFEMRAEDYQKQRIDALLALLAADQRAGIVDADLQAAIDDWRRHPFDPHRIARLRPVAYQRATVMKFIDNLIAWGDLLYQQFTMETVNEAAQLYLLADMLLGPRPERVRLPPTPVSKPLTYSDMAADPDDFSNVLVDIENLVVVPNGASTPPDGPPSPPLPRIVTGTGKLLYFCIPPNQTMLSYWDVVAERLFNIRHCMNIAGVVGQPALYEPPIDPLLLAKAATAGVDLSALGIFQPIYRFATYLQKAVELTNDVRTLGGMVLSALEKKDAEALTVLRSAQEVDMLERVRDVKQQQVDEAKQSLASLNKQKDLITIRRDYYRDIKFMNTSELGAMAQQRAALLANTGAVELDMVAGVVYLVPLFSLGASGFGGTPLATADFGGENIAKAASAWAGVARGLAGLAAEGGQMASTLGGYQRRQDDWDLQRRTADKELEQIDKQIVGAEIRVAIAQNELANHDKQVENVKAVDDFLHSKYTSGELYDWMLSQLTTVHAQAYQLAVTLGKRANTAYQFELGTDDQFIQFGYWDGQRKGLLAAENLLFDLRRMEAAYLEANARELEIVKHVSLALTQPDQLVRLRETGTCDVALSENLFDRDYPGHYFRRLRKVAVTVPCVTGPYTGVNGTLTLTGSAIRNKKVLDGSGVRDGGGAGTQIAFSSAQNDPGLFEANMRDERYLPFEGRGAVSQWNLAVPPSDNAFDLSTISDAILHVYYTARTGLDAVKVRNALPPNGGHRSILLSAAHMSADSYYRFFHPTGDGPQVFGFSLSPAVFPYAAIGTPHIARIQIFACLDKTPEPGTLMKIDIGPAGGTATSVVLEVNATFGAVLTKDVSFTSTAAPSSWTVTLTEANVPAALGTTVDGHKRLDPAHVQDILLLIEYVMS